ncbi:unnamed protein product [Rotaria sp. Silwood2]|nr:unnamed protein product [Rotaria sp. Silwood2]CAF2798829.1 unnamed protein product [Rotaria sp. Silwood2]CAF3383147.1 unnamed protein product [Rotaria sp. Silwood2]CAF4440071.1 unnamed protein product [Rotaria sp. Silwood2]CAF4466162.1 unnamed protein product [Rotaria sp. Silwood2]
MTTTIDELVEIASMIKVITFNELLGEQLLEHNESNNESNQISTNELNEKSVGLYFSAYSSSACRNFTPKLAAFFKGHNSEIEDKLEIVFISYDEDQADFDEYFKKMPWKALPFSDRDRSKILHDKFHIKDIPTLIILSSTREVTVFDGVDYIRGVYNGGAIRHWSKGKRLFRSCEAHEGEYVWDGIICHQCYMSPIIGSRHGCVDKKCYVDLCETCLSKTKHEHPLVEYLVPKRQYSFEQLFKSVPHLLNPNSEEKIETKAIWENGVKCVGFYFSAHWCEPCRIFTPKLIKAYKEAQANSLSFCIVFVSSDFDEQSFNEYRSAMPWPAVPLDSIIIVLLSEDIPRFFIVSSDGKVLSRHGVNDVKRKGIEALKTWMKGETLAPSTADEFEWADVSCDGCSMSPIIGQRYRCSTCGNHDLCSACEKKGHEHPLELVPQPIEYEDD